MKIKKLSLVWMVCFTCLLSCKKHPDNCEEIQQVRITGAKNSYTIGDSIHLQVNLLPTIALFSWNRNDNPNTISGTQDLFIYPCQKSDEGWYYLHLSYPDCASNDDSVYISIKNKIATAPCNIDNNSVSFSSIPSVTLNGVTWGMDPSFGRRRLGGSSTAGYPGLNIYFHSFWDNKEPEDGEYNIAERFSLTESNPYVVYMNTMYSSILFQAGPGKAYVTHVNGKLQVKFCSVNFSGSLGGPVFNTTASATVTAP